MTKQTAKQEESPVEVPIEVPIVRSHSDGRFIKGVSGNPAGRRLGAIGKYTELARGLLGSKSEEIVAVIIEKALAGDVHCLKMCLDRIIPTRRAESTIGTTSAPKIVINVNNSEKEKIIDSTEFAEEVEFKTEEEVEAEIK